MRYYTCRTIRNVKEKQWRLQCAKRLKLIAENRRFTILDEKGARPNLASQLLGMAMRELPAGWKCARSPGRSTGAVQRDPFRHPSKLMRIMTKGGLL